MIRVVFVMKRLDHWRLRLFYQDTALIISRNGGLAYEGMY